MALTEEDKNWIVEVIMKANQHSTIASERSQGTYSLKDRQRQDERGRIERVARTGERAVVGGVRLAGLGLAVVARTTQVATRALGAGVDVYVSELEKAMNQKHRQDSLLD